MVYASDLDRTLIYSQTFLDMHPTKDEVILVDEAKVNSFMTKTVASEMNTLLNQGVRFIPVTARSMEQYLRIKFPFSAPEYAITTNGAKILHNGKELEAWEKEVSGRIQPEAICEVVKALNKLPEVNYEGRVVDKTYAFTKTTDIKRTKERLNSLGEQFPAFNFYVDKHKLYGVPKCFGKGLAIRWLMNYLGETELVASGDSLFDVPLLDEATLAIAPLHKTFNDLEVNSTLRVVVGWADSPVRMIKAVRETFHITEPM